VSPVGNVSICKNAITHVNYQTSLTLCLTEKCYISVPVRSSNRSRSDRYLTSLYLPLIARILISGYFRQREPDTETMASFISRIASVFRRSKPQEEEEYSSDALDNEDFEVASKNLGGRGKGAHRTSNNEDVDEEMDEMEIEDRRLEEAERSLAKRKSPNRKKRTSGVEKGEVEVVQDGKDALDEEDYEATTTTKRKRGSDTKNSPTRNPGSTRKKAKIEADVGVEEEELDDANAENRRKSAGTKKTSAGKKNEVVKKRTKVVEELYVEDESKRDSDALDDSDFEVGKGTKKSPKNGVKGKGRPKKEDHEVESDSEEEGERVTVVGKIVEAPTTGRGKSPHVVFESRLLTQRRLPS
jgi:hypothetical protein